MTLRRRPDRIGCVCESRALPSSTGVRHSARLPLASVRNVFECLVFYVLFQEGVGLAMVLISRVFRHLLTLFSRFPIPARDRLQLRSGRNLAPGRLVSQGTASSARKERDLGVRIGGTPQSMCRHTGKVSNDAFGLPLSPLPCPCLHFDLDSFHNSLTQIRGTSDPQPHPPSSASPLSAPHWH